MQQNLFEAYHNGVIYSRNDRQYFELKPKRYALMMVPKLSTSICTKELEEASKLYKPNMAFFAGSTDSPETAEAVLSAEKYPFLHIAPRHELFKEFIDDDGYCTRTAVLVEDNKIAWKYTVPDESKRDVDAIFSVL